MNIEDFNYHLPKELIAQTPVEPRTHSRLLVLNSHPSDLSPEVQHKHFYNLPDYLKEGDVLVLNETKVLKIKIEGKKQTGGKIELMLENDQATVKGKVKVGDILLFPKKITALIQKKDGNKLKLKFNKSQQQVINEIGQLPLPPYIKSKIKSDSQYQTVFAKIEGSFAAPTAGLHFDEKLLNKIKDKGVKIAKVCLHVSWDTFLQIKESDPTKHQMHGEVCEISAKNAEVINKAKRVFVVGTTSLRTLESFAQNGKVSPGKKLTKIFIYPGYKWQLKYAGLITNFHLPKSTLLMMISAFYNKTKIFQAYNEAVKEKYRFFSLGDAMLLLT